MLLTMIAVGAAALPGSAHGRHHVYDGPVIQSPVWAKAPSFADVAAAYPARARGVDGSATLFCRFDVSGALSGCEVASETPGGLGFGEAARSLAGKFVVSVDPSWSMRSERFGVEVPVRMMAPNGPEMRDRLVSRPIWTTRFTSTAAASFFPPDAAAKGLSTGRGVAECKVEADGALHECRGVSGEPDDAGFAQAAAKAASGMRMSTWTADGGPVDGATVRVPIRLTIDDTPQDAAADHVVWAETPTGVDVLHAFPRLALRRGVGGQADMRCRVEETGAVSQCDIIDESPSGWGFGSAARDLAPKYRVSMRADGHPAPGSWIRISVPIQAMSH